MEPALLVVATWLAFFGTHLGLASGPVRSALVARLGEGGFIKLFSAVAAATFAIWVFTTASVRLEGLPGLALGSHPAIHAAALVAIVAGFALLAGSYSSYPSSPMAVLARRVRDPRGVERVTRHALFAGLALFAGAHVLIVPTLAQAVFFAGLAVHAVLGAAHQDRKLVARLGAPYRAYLERTSGVPFAAILAGRQRFAPADQPWIAYAVGALLALGLRPLHAHLFDHGGLWIVVAVVAGAAVAGRDALRMGRGRKAQHA
jgi:uncharacterized membrane protein